MIADRAARWRAIKNDKMKTDFVAPLGAIAFTVATRAGGFTVIPGGNDTKPARHRGDELMTYD